MLYISIHRYDSGVFYPGSAYGSNQACGEGAGVGRNVNIGWERGGKGDADYLYAFQKIVMPICYEFAPELVLGQCLTFSFGVRLQFKLTRQSFPPHLAAQSLPGSMPLEEIPSEDAT